ncbi:MULTISPECIES: hypothetical protein [Streptomyces]|uniref:hypothetical protein n=1 Tax=Streptomyces TaxID=1883 RepID=UPI00240CF9EB|nr:MULTISPECIES: hypothetical protein [Streptomyces]WFB88521.1 hypothetical protein MMU79_37430 [Streptomyces olivaceus]WGK50663.1 hypothetical protein M6G09_36455 [Streptomyces sp. B146]
MRENPSPRSYISSAVGPEALSLPLPDSSRTTPAGKLSTRSRIILSPETGGIGRSAG